MEARKPFNIELTDSQDYQRLMQPPQTCGMKAGRVFLGPGDEGGRQNTEGREEMLVFLNGRGQIVFNEKGRLLVGKGKVLYIPPNTQHNIVNTGSDPLVYIYCTSPMR